MNMLKTPFGWLNSLICRLVGCGLGGVSAMAFGEKSIQPVEVLIICPRCGKPHMHDLTEEAPMVQLDLKTGDMSFIEEESMNPKTLN